MPRSHRPGSLAAFLSLAISCTSDEGGDGDETTTSTTSTTSTTTTSGADVEPSCIDALGNNGDLVTAYELAQYVNDIGELRQSLSAQICTGESDFFRLQPSCIGYLGIEVIVDDDGDDVTLYLRDSGGNPLVASEGSPATNVGAYRMEAIHHIVTLPDEELFIEVVHESGDQVPYTITTYFLPNGSCMAASWGCEATENLEAIETSCTTEPSSGECPSLSKTTTPVDLPTVGVGMAAFSGWLVHEPASAVKFHARPSEGEYSDILERCEEACRAQWASNPDVEANCNDTEILETPFLFEKPSYPALAVIPSTYQNGGELFVGEDLACNLHDSCCEAFDEALCGVAVPLRLTPASLPVGLGEEYRFAVDSGSSTITAEALGENDGSALEGEIGFSLCRDGNDWDSCPFYLGHVDLVATDDLEVEVTCPDESLETLTLSNLEIHLAQPAFGINQAIGQGEAFPPGALVFNGQFDLGMVHYSIRGPNTEPVVFEADETYFYASGIEIVGTAPCGDGTATATGSFRLVNQVMADPLDSPPSISIDIPSAVSCPSSVSLSATTDDPDDDLVSVRWYIDDVLMSASTTSVTFSGPHLVRAVATDARGGSTTAIASVDCT